MTVKVIDSICGSGKSTEVRKALKQQKDAAQGNSERVLFCTPYLSEIDETVHNLSWFKSPQVSEGKKLNGLKELLRNQEPGIFMTHALLLRLDDECRSLIYDGRYGLILDETISPIEDFSVGKEDFESITDGDRPLIAVDDQKRVLWLASGLYDGKYNDLKELCDGGTLIVTEGDRNIHMVWTYKMEEMMDSFSSVLIMTYLFETSYMRAMLPAGTAVEYVKIKEIEERDQLIRENIKNGSLIKIYEGRYNLPPELEKRTALSLGWMNSHKKDLSGSVSRLFRGFFEYYAKVKEGEYMWTTFHLHRARLVGTSGRFSSGFIPCNMRATNDYKDRRVVGYIVNRFLNPNIRKAFPEYLTDDNFALNELVQFVFRSQLRMGMPILLYVPSERMRKILRDWLSTL